MMLTLEGISAGYGETQVLYDISLKAEERSLTVMVGPNGAGKTTTLRTINGLQKVWNGRVEFDGRNITRLPAYARVEIGMASVPEGRRLFPLLTTEANLKLGAYCRRARGSAEETLGSVYSLFPKLKERRSVKAGRLSGGEQQMVAIGRALMAKPSLMILDEPSLGIGPRLVVEIFDTVRELQKEGLTVLMVEQNAYRALKYADYAYVLQEGRILRSGIPSELMNVEELRKAYFSIA
jgi:branched-chain amino acid transport system ATP-binding protein